jgi:hypothetical protein
MSAPRQSLPLRFAHSSVELALRFWPEESRHWGHALAAELHEIERPFEAIHWALGGLMLFTRATASHFLSWLKLPAGSRMSASSLPLGTSSPILPKRSRLFTAAVLVATVVVLFLPQSRVAISTVRATWQGFELWDSDRHTLEKLAARAEKEKDARTLAFVALTFPDSDQGMRLADKAVALDPSLTWIYASRFYRPDSVPLPPEWLARLHASDPDNGFIDLTAADAIAQPRYWAMVQHRTPAPGGFESALASDPKWVAEMEVAFHAPRYNNYIRKHWELICYEWDRDPALSPAIIGYGLWSHRIPNVQNLRIFARFEIQRARQELANGHPDEATRILREVDGFANLMSQQKETGFERLTALELSREATEGLQNLYSATGRTREASDASARLQKTMEDKRTYGSPSIASYLVFSNSFNREAIVFQSCAILLVVCGVTVAFTFLVLEIRPRSFPKRRGAWQRILCRTADYAPAAFLILSFAFLVSFLPIARLFTQYRSASASISTFQEISGTLWGLMDVPVSLQEVLNPPFFWLLLTAALIILAALFLFRLFTGAKPAAQTAP